MTDKLEPLTAEEIHVLQSYIFNLCMEKDIRQPHELLARLLAHHAALTAVAEAARSVLKTERIPMYEFAGKEERALYDALRAAGYPTGGKNDVQG